MHVISGKLAAGYIGLSSHITWCVFKCPVVAGGRAGKHRCVWLRRGYWWCIGAAQRAPAQTQLPAPNSEEVWTKFMNFLNDIFRRKYTEARCAITSCPSLTCARGSCRSLTRGVWLILGCLRGGGHAHTLPPSGINRGILTNYFYWALKAIGLLSTLNILR